jgi:hypothetical protein
MLTLLAQVRLPRPLLARSRVLAPKDLFEAIELCLGPAKEGGKAPASLRP